MAPAKNGKKQGGGGRLHLCALRLKHTTYSISTTKTVNRLYNYLNLDSLNLKPRKTNKTQIGVKIIFIIING